MIGLDTGFFVKLLEGDIEAVSVWKLLLDDKEAAVVSCLTLFELEKLSLKGKLDRADVDLLFDGVNAVCLITWLDTIKNLQLGAKLSHGIGIPAVDSLILSGFLISGVNTIYTTDSDLEAYKKHGVNVINMQKKRTKSR